MKGRGKGKRRTKKRPRCALCGGVLTKANAWKSNPYIHEACALGGPEEGSARP